MTAQDWPDPHAAVVERALKMQRGTILAREVLALRAQIAALTAEHSGACDDMAVCGNCWTAERIDAAAHAEAQIAAVRALHERVTFTDVSLGIRDLPVCARCHIVLAEPDDWNEVTSGEWRYPFAQERWPCKTAQALDVPPDVTR